MEHFHGNFEVMSLIQSMDAALADPANPATNDALKHMYTGSLLGICALVMIIFYHRGAKVITGILAYLLSLSTMTIAVKSVFVNQHFNFPMFVTSCHFLCCGFLCFGILAYQQMRGGKKVVVPDMKQMTAMIVPIAIAFAGSVGFNNIALLHSNAAFAEMVAGASPICVICIHLVEGKGFNLKLLMPVLGVVAGVALCASGELKFTWFGLGLIFLAAFLRAYKSTLQQKLMEHDAGGDRLEPIELLAWMSPPCLIVMGVWGGLTEGMEPILQLTNGKTLEIALAIGVTCLNAMVLNVANNYVIRDLGAVGCLLVGQLKGILVLAGAAVLLGEVIQMQQMFGYCLIAVGVYRYNKMDKDIKDAVAKNLKAIIESTPLVVKVVE